MDALAGPVGRMTDDEPVARTFVIAGTYGQYTDWCRRNDRRPREPDVVPVITSMPDCHFRLDGYEVVAGRDTVVKVGTYAQQRYAWRALQALERRRRDR